MPRGDDSIRLIDIIEATRDDMHVALHNAINFPDPEMAHMPGLNIGWEGGLLFGIHLACQYPHIAAQIEKRAFRAFPEMAGPQRAADVMAEALGNFLGGPAQLSGRTLAERLAALAEKHREAETTTDTPFWPLPEHPHPYHGYEPGEGI